MASDAGRSFFYFRHVDEIHVGEKKLFGNPMITTRPTQRSIVRWRPRFGGDGWPRVFKRIFYEPYGDPYKTYVRRVDTVFDKGKAPPPPSLFGYPKRR